MKRTLQILMLFVIAPFLVYAQNVGINTSGAAPNSSALLDLNTGNTFGSGTSKGLLIPNVALTGINDASTISTPATSLLVYNTGFSPQGYYYNSGTPIAPVWTQIGTGSSSGGSYVKDSVGFYSWLLAGNSGTTPGTNFVGTTDNEALEFKTNNTFSGILDPTNQNVYFGTSAGNNVGTNSVILGYQAGASLPSASTNDVAIGYGAMQLARGASSNYNVAIGAEALQNDSVGSYNVALGYASLQKNTNGIDNIALGGRYIGGSTLAANTSGSGNIALGAGALASNTTGNSNIAIGRAAAKANTTGYENIVIGGNSMPLNTTDSNQIIIGFGALSDVLSGSPAKYNLLIGNNSMSLVNAGSYNVGIGYNTIYQGLGAISYNVAIGYQALMESESTSLNASQNDVAIGYEANENDSGGSSNTAIGYEALFRTSANGISGSGGGNTGIGANAMSTNHNGTNNTTLGYRTNVALSNLTNATAIGYAAVAPASNSVTLGNTAVTGVYIPGTNYSTLYNMYYTSNTNGLLSPITPGAPGTFLTMTGTGPSWAAFNDWLITGNSGVTYAANFLGTQSGTDQGVKFEINGVISGRIEDNNPTNGSKENTGLGYEALNVNTGTGNVALGYKTLTANTTGKYNIAIGDSALSANTTSSSNIAIGANTLAALNTNSGNNIAIGNSALENNTSKDEIAIGLDALESNTTGTQNIGIGMEALTRNISGQYNIGIGGFALQFIGSSVLDVDNIAIGYGAGGLYGNNPFNSNSPSTDNTVIGFEALSGNSWEGSQNTVVGSQAMGTNNSGGNGPSSANTAVGYQTLSYNVSNNNTAVGWEALVASTSDNNTAIGYDAGSIETTGANNTYIGYNANPSAGGFTNATAIGNGATVGASNAMELGNSGVVFTGINGAAYNSSYAISVGTGTGNGNVAYCTTGGAWVNGSDRNIKANFKTLDGKEMLEKITELSVLRWNYKNEPASVQHIGPIAQDFYRLFHVGNDSLHISTIDPSGVALVGVQALNKKLERENAAMKAEIDSLADLNKTMSSKMSQMQSKQAKYDADKTKDEADIAELKKIIYSSTRMAEVQK